MVGDHDMSESHAEWAQRALRIGAFVAVHPLEYAKILIQVGYEPLPPRPTRTLFGRPALGLPNIFQYIGYLKKKRGFFGLYHGTSARLCGSIVHNYVLERITKLFPIKNETAAEEIGDGDTEASDEEDKVLTFFQKTVRDLIAQCAAVIASHPFQVITVRMIAQFVGEEQKYSILLHSTTRLYPSDISCSNSFDPIAPASHATDDSNNFKVWTKYETYPSLMRTLREILRGLLTSLQEIYKAEGIGGFFAGLAPRILGELFSLWLSTCLTFAINTYVVKDTDLRNYIGPSMSFIAVAVTYPFSLVSRVMCVNNSGLAAGMPPNMPIYTSWTDCWSHLKTQNQLKRGSSILWRYYTGPYILRDGKPELPNLKHFRAPIRSKNE